VPVDTSGIRDYGVATMRWPAIILLAVLLLGHGADLPCAVSLDDCCDQSHCVMCNHQMLPAPAVAGLDIARPFLAMMGTEVTAPTAPSLDRLYPPPRA
jgi:hypothetical protein